MTRGSRLAPLLALVLVCALVPGVAAADSTDGYSIEATTSIDTPQRTLTILGRDFNVSSLGRVDEGETVRAAVSRPGDGDFSIYLYSYGGERKAAVEGSQNGTYTLAGTGSLDPGTYLLTLSIGGSFERVQPVVVSGYEFAVDASPEASPGEPVSIDVTLTGDAPLPNYVEVVVMNDSLRRYTAAHLVGTRRYSVIVDDLGPGEYRFYANAHNDSQVAGVSSVQSLAIGDPDGGSTTATPTTTSNGDSGTVTAPGQGGSIGAASPTTQSGSTQSVATPTVETSAVATTKSTQLSSSKEISTVPTTVASWESSSTSEDPTTGASDAVGSAGSPGMVSTEGPDASASGSPVATPGFTAVTAALGFAIFFFFGLRD